MVICVFGTGMNWKCEGGGNDIKRAENVFSLRTNKDTAECLYCSVKTAGFVRCSGRWRISIRQS